jgi:hypothetical protein
MIALFYLTGSPKSRMHVPVPVAVHMFHIASFRLAIMISAL